MEAEPVARDGILLVDAPGDLNVPNIGLGAFAARCRSMALNASVIHSLPSEGWQEFVCKAVERTKPRIVGFSIHCTTVREALEWVAQYGPLLPTDTVVVFGGPQAGNELADQSLAEFHSVEYRPVNFDLIDLPGELASPPVVYVHESGFDPDYIPAYENWDAAPFADYPMLFSSGCPNSCSFCGLCNVSWQARNRASAIEELLTYPLIFKSSRVTIWDSNFTCLREHTMPIAHQLNETVRLPWRANGVCLKDCVDLELVKELADLGCYQLYFGIETIHGGMLHAKGGGALSIGLANHLLDCMRKVGIVSIGSFICGLEGETTASTYEAFEEASKTRFDYQVWSLPVPMPNTPLLSYVKAKGRHLLDYRQCSYQHSVVAFDTPEFPAPDRMTAIRFIQSRTRERREELRRRQQLAFGRALAAIHGSPEHLEDV